LIKLDDLFIQRQRWLEKHGHIRDIADPDGYSTAEKVVIAVSKVREEMKRIPSVAQGAKQRKKPPVKKESTGMDEEKQVEDGEVKKEKLAVIPEEEKAQPPPKLIKGTNFAHEYIYGEEALKYSLTPGWVCRRPVKFGLFNVGS